MTSSPRSFPEDFLWGSATASYQIEGAADEDGRGPSIWDTFSHTPGKVSNGDTGDVADDHYHRWPQDVAPDARSSGLQAYRFSIAWPRDPARRPGAANPKGLDFYSRLVDGAARRAASSRSPRSTTGTCRRRCEDAGGWPNRDTALRFADYAEHRRRRARRPGLDVDDAQRAVVLGVPRLRLRRARPGPHRAVGALRAAHHLNLGHGLAGRGDPRACSASAQLSVTLNLHVTRPVEPRFGGRPGRGPAARRGRQPGLPRPHAGRRLPGGPARRHRLFLRHSVTIEENSRPSLIPK